MSKAAKNVKNSLKFKAQPKGNLITVRLGVRKFNVPVETRMLSNGEFMYLSFPAVTELYRIDGKTLKPMGPEEDASQAFDALNTGRRRGGRRKRAQAELPPEVKEALKSLPAGYKLGYSADGELKLVKTRQRRKSK